MTERQTLCRQVASLLALTRSPNAHEAEAAKQKAKEMIARHTLMLGEVQPYLNAVGLEVAHTYLRAEEPQRPAPQPTPGPASFDFSAYAEVLRRAVFYGTGAWPSTQGVDWRSAEESQGTYIGLDGRRVRVEDLPDATLRALETEFSLFGDRTKVKENEAHDFIDEGQYAAAISVLQRLMQRIPPYPEDVETAIRNEIKRRFNRECFRHW